MAWDHLDIDKPHLAYIILGGFTGLFMLCSLFVKEKLYIGEATVATICGIIFGPHAANLFNPLSWGNVDKITLECARIVLVVQCFAVGVELPKAYMERHWKSVFLLLVPVMTWGWLATSLFIWWMVPPLDWLESLVCAACVTATDPVLASSVVGKGKFAKRVPKHLRDILSAESGCNDGMAFPFIYLSYYIWAYRPDANRVALNWFCVTILYECVFGAFYGFILGYLARHAIRFAENHQLVDRESFLVFYFVLAIFCAGSGSLLGMDDLLIGFSAGVGFSNDGWFTEKTEESHVSDVIDLLLNLAFFVYFGSIVPWQDFNNHEIGLIPWRLVVIAIFVIFFRRIPAMLLFKPLIPDIKTWREALFAGHFGPIGVGAIFAAILARAELEGHDTQPERHRDLPGPGAKNYYVVEIIWPLTTFIIVSSILVHGSSIAVFTLGKRINTMTVTLSYTTANEEGPSWMNRLPRMQSLGKGSMSLRKQDETDESPEEEFAPGTLPPIGIPGNFLRRVKAEDSDQQNVTHVPGRRRRRNMREEDYAGGPISQSAISPLSRLETQKEQQQQKEEREKDEKDEAELQDEIDRGVEPPNKRRDIYGREPDLEVYQEGENMIIEDAEGNVLKTENISHMSEQEREQHIVAEKKRLMEDRTGRLAKSQSQQHTENEGEEIQHKAEEAVTRPASKARNILGRLFGLKKEQEPDEKKEAARKEKVHKNKARSAHAYQFGNTIIVEDEDGEVLRKYDIPSSTAEEETTQPVRRGLARVGTWLGKDEDGGEPSSSKAKASKAAANKAAKAAQEDKDDDGLRFTVAQNDNIQEGGVGHKGRRMNKNEFISQIQKRGPKARSGLVDETDAPKEVKEVAHGDIERKKEQQRWQQQEQQQHRQRNVSYATTTSPSDEEDESSSESAEEDDDDDDSDRFTGHNIASSLARFTSDTPAQARRSDLSAHPPLLRRDSEDDGTERVPPAAARVRVTSPAADTGDATEAGETAVERRRRLAALGQLNDQGSDSDEPEDETTEASENDITSSRPSRVQFAEDTRPARNRSRRGRSTRMRSRSRRPRVSFL